MSEAGTDVDEAGTGGVGAVVVDVVVLFEAASSRPRAEVSRVVEESLGWLWGSNEPSIKGMPNLPDREAGLTCWVARRVYWQMRRVRRRFPGCHSRGHPRGVERRLVERCRSGLPMKSLVNRCRRTRSGWR